MARFDNEQDWFTVTAAMAVWAAHFMLLWSASVVFPGQLAARWIALALTAAAAGALAWLWYRARRAPRTSAAALALGIAAAGVAFGVAPALLG